MPKTHSRYYNFDNEHEYQKSMKEDLRQAKMLLDRKRAGQRVDTSVYKAQLCKAGIYDRTGKLKEIYRTGVKK